MAGTPSVRELVLRWLERRHQGQRVTPEEICSDCPQLLAEVKREIEAIASMESFLDLDASLGGSKPTPRWQESAVAPGGASPEGSDGELSESLAGGATPPQG